MPRDLDKRRKHRLELGRTATIEIRVKDKAAQYTVPVAVLRDVYKLLEEYPATALTHKTTKDTTRQKMPWELAALKMKKGDRVKRYRMHAKMTQVELAEKCVTTQANIAYIEANKRPFGVYFAQKLGDVFGVDYRVFL